MVPSGGDRGDFGRFQRYFSLYQAVSGVVEQSFVGGDVIRGKRCVGSGENRDNRFAVGVEEYERRTGVFSGAASHAGRIDPMLLHRLENVIGPIVDADIADEGDVMSELGRTDCLIDPFAPGVACRRFGGYRASDVR